STHHACLVDSHCRTPNATEVMSTTLGIPAGGRISEVAGVRLKATFAKLNLVKATFSRLNLVKATFSRLNLVKATFSQDQPHELGTGGDRGLLEDLAQVVVHRAGAEEQLGGDLPVGQPLADGQRDAQLLRG